MLSIEGDADAAVQARIQVGWNKFMQLVPLLTNEDVSLIRRGILVLAYPGCPGKKAVKPLYVCAVSYTHLTLPTKRIV